MEDYSQMDNVVKDLKTCLESQRLIYRPIEDSDADKKFLGKIFDDPVNKGLSRIGIFRPSIQDRNETVKSFVDAKGMLLGSIICLPASPDHGQGSQHGAEEDGGPTPIGFVALYRSGGESWAHFQAAMAGIALDDPYQGKGYGREALNWLIDWGFRFGNLHRISIGSVEYNQRALKLYRSLGFVDEGRDRKLVYFNTKWYDLVNMGMLVEEWRTLRGLE